MIKTVNILIILLIYKQDSLPVQRICKEQTAVFHSGGQTTHNRKKAAGPWDSALNQAVCDELVLVDIDKKRAEGEAMDLNHGVAFASSSMRIYAGDYSDCSDADLVVICAGVSQKPGESRLELLQRNTAVFQSIISPITRSGFSGIFLVATNPVDIMTRVTYELSGFNASRVFGTGTTLDTARLRYLLGDYFSVDPRNMHAYVIGEHGDSEFVPWSQAMPVSYTHLTLPTICSV